MANRQVCAMAIEENGNTTLPYVYTDHLGSINAVTNAAGVLEAKLDFDAWGRRRNPVDYSYLPNNTVQIDNGLNTSSTLPAWLYRGYTGHEMLDEFTLINMNARLYDPVLGLMAGVDNVIQAPNYTQNYSRYSYCDNNPLKYTDPDGNRFTAAHLALAGIGGQAAWGPLMQHAQGKINGWQAAGLYGVNAVSFVVAGTFGYSAIPFGKCIAMVAGSAVSSIGNIAIGVQDDFVLSFGFGNYNLTQNSCDYLLDGDNHWLQDAFYALGAIGVLQDVFAGMNGTEILLKSRQKFTGHSESVDVNNPDNYISVIPEQDLNESAPNQWKWEKEYVKRAFAGKQEKGINKQIIDPSDPQITTRIPNVNSKLYTKWINNLKDDSNLLGTAELKYGGPYNGCVMYNARGLIYSGVFNANALLPVTSPLFLNAELMFYNTAFATLGYNQNQFYYRK